MRNFMLAVLSASILLFAGCGGSSSPEERGYDFSRYWFPTEDATFVYSYVKEDNESSEEDNTTYAVHIYDGVVYAIDFGEMDADYKIEKDKIISLYDDYNTTFPRYVKLGQTYHISGYEDNETYTYNDSKIKIESGNLDFKPISHFTEKEIGGQIYHDVLYIHFRYTEKGENSKYRYQKIYDADSYMAKGMTQISEQSESTETITDKSDNRIIKIEGGNFKYRERLIRYIPWYEYQNNRIFKSDHDNYLIIDEYGFLHPYKTTSEGCLQEVQKGDFNYALRGKRAQFSDNAIIVKISNNDTIMWTYDTDNRKIILQANFSGYTNYGNLYMDDTVIQGKTYKLDLSTNLLPENTLNLSEMFCRH